MMPTFDEIARMVGVELCRHCSIDFIPKRGRRNHNSGWAQPGIVHWSPRKATRAGIRHFLILVAEAKEPFITELTPWMRIWTSNVEAQRLAQVLGVAFPRILTAKDRARVRLYLSEEQERAHYGNLYTQAQRWSARS